MSRAFEIGSVVLIAIVVILGGRELLLGIATHRGIALLVLAILFVLQSVALRRNYAERGPLVQVRATRDVAFIAAILLALVTVASPQRWSIGATISAVEFGLVLDILSRLAPVLPVQEKGD